MAEDTNCLEVKALLPELAAGVAEGDARAQALTHLANCTDCRRELDETTAVLDGLLLLAPQRQPAAGFESTVLAAMSPTRRAPSRATRMLLAAAATLIVAALGAGLVWWNTGDDRHLAAQYRRTLSVADGRYLAAAKVNTATGATAGHVFAYAGNPSWVFMTIEHAPTSGTFQVQLVTTSHRTIDVGSCEITSGKGTWGWRLYLPVHDIASIQLVQTGAPIMSATFG